MKAQNTGLESGGSNSPPHHFNPLPQAGGDSSPLYFICMRPTISTHSPQAGGDGGRRRLAVVAVGFQPTPPKRGETMQALPPAPPPAFQPTPPKRGETRNEDVSVVLFVISTHSPQAGGDMSPGQFLQQYGQFQPTPPKRGETARAFSASVTVLFQPTPPKRGETATLSSTASGSSIFQPTPPKRGETYGYPTTELPYRFQPTPPKRGETSAYVPQKDSDKISTHSPQAGGDSRCSFFAHAGRISTHSPQAGGDAVSLCG